MEARLNIVIAAMTGAGKTTLLRAMALQTRATERIITIERGRELRLAECGHLDVAELETRDPNTEARGGSYG